jgi:hypothetical protein
MRLLFAATYILISRFRRVAISSLAVFSILALSGCATAVNPEVNQFRMDPPIKKYIDVAKDFKKTVNDNFQDGTYSDRVMVEIEDTVNQGFMRTGLRSNVDTFQSRFRDNLPDTNIRMIIFNDPKWALKKVKKLYQGETDIIYVTNDFGKGKYFDNDYCDGQPGLYGYTYPFDEPLILISAQCTPTKYFYDKEKAAVQLSIVSHELVHVAQLFWTSSYDSCYLPNWLIEGQAQALSSVLTVGFGSNTQEILRKDWFNWNPDGRIDDNEKYIKPGSEEGDGGVYSDGALATEYLVARSGWPKMIKVMKFAEAIASGKCNSFSQMYYFKTAFRIIYGQEFQDFQNEVRAYLKWAIIEDSNGN